jgi:hypothetical protein
LGDVAKKALEVAEKLPQATRARLAWEASKKGVSTAFDFLAPDKRLTPTEANPMFQEGGAFDGGDKAKPGDDWESRINLIKLPPEPDYNYKDGVMLELQKFTDVIPDFLLRREDDTDQYRPWESISAEVNSMQARGLGMGAVNVPKEVKDQVSLLQQIRDTLKRAGEEGMIFPQ